MRSSPPIVGAIVPVDGALSPDGRYMAIASAGAFEDAMVEYHALRERAPGA